MEPPRWVTDMTNSGLLYEVHKFSKFIHGCSTLIPENLQCVPYWVNDISVRDYIISSGGRNIMVRSDIDEKEKHKLKMLVRNLAPTRFMTTYYFFEI